MQAIMLNVTSGSIPPVVHMSQFDYKKQIAFDLYDGDEVYTIPSGAIVSVCGTKFDGHPFNYDSSNDPTVVTYSGSVVTVYTTVQMTAAAGKATCELKIASDSATLYTLNFVMDVEAAALPADVKLSEMDIPLIIKAIEGGQAVADIDDKLTKAEGYIEQMDADVTASASSAKDASTSATNAASSASTASSKASAAASSATKAKTSETNAAASATAASSSASDAAKSASAAADSATDASDSAKLSESWAVGGTSTRTGEDTNNSKYYADLAKKYEEAAAKTDVGSLAKLIDAVEKAEATVEKNLTAVNHDESTYPAFVADRLANVDDLDTCTTNGIYQFTATASNNPVSAIGMVLVLNSTGSGESGYIAQYAWAASDAHTVYARDDHGGTWGAWEQVGADGSVITDITKRLTTAESNITSQGTRLSSAESNITSQGTRLSSAESNISKLDSGKADKATTLAGYGITDGATKTELATKADQSGFDVTYAMAKNLSDNFGLLSTTPMFFGCNGDKSLDSFETGIQLLNGSILGISDWFLIIGTGTMGTGMQVAFGLSSNSLIKRYASGGSINGWVRLI